MSLVQPAQEAGEKVYEAWSRPSVEVTAAHQPLDTTELGVSVGDTASVLRKSDSGDQLQLSTFECSEMFVSTGVVVFKYGVWSGNVTTLESVNITRQPGAAVCRWWARQKPRQHCVMTVIGRRVRGVRRPNEVPFWICTPPARLGFIQSFLMGKQDLLRLS